MEQAAKQDQTPQRILLEAERLFAEKGFDGVSVREITRAAGVNTAAVNYHFGSKKNLYLEVFRQRWVARAIRVRENLADLLGKPGLTVEEMVRRLAHEFLFNVFSDRNDRMLHYKLMQREMDAPSEALALVMNEGVTPNLKYFALVLRHACPDISEEAAPALAMSIIAQLIYFSQAAETLMQGNGLIPIFGNMDECVEHITRFSIHGINGFGDMA